MKKDIDHLSDDTAMNYEEQKDTQIKGILSSSDFEVLTFNAANRRSTIRDTGKETRGMTAISTRARGMTKSEKETAESKNSDHKQLISQLHESNIFHRSYIEHWSQLLIKYKDRKK